MAFCKPDDFLFQRRSSFQILRCGLFGKGNGRNFLCVAQGDARCPEAKMFPSQDVHMADHFPRRSSLQILTALEGHVQDSGKELLAALKDVISLEKEIKIVRLLEKDKICLEKDLRLREKDLRLTEKEDLKNRYFLDMLKVQGLNNTRGLFEHMHEVLACGSARSGTKLWEDILINNPSLSGCIPKALALLVKDVQRMSIHCYTIYNILSQYIHVGKEVATLQTSNGGKVHFHTGPMSP